MSFIGGGYSQQVLVEPNTRCRQPITYEVITPPVALPISLVLVKEQLRIVGDDTQDAYLTLLIQAASNFFQNYTGRILINTGFRTFRNFFKRAIELRRSKLQTLDAFSYIDTDDIVTVVSPTIYYNTFENDYSRIIINEVTNIPQDVKDQFNALTIDFTAGYGIDDTFIPPDIQLALLNHVNDLYANRGDCSTCGDGSSGKAIPANALNTYNQYRIINIAGEWREV